MIEFKSLTDEEFQEIFNTPPMEKTINLVDGEGDWEVLTAKESISKSSNNPMVILTLKVWDKTGYSKNVTIYLVINQKIAFCMKKIKDFWYSCGFPEFWHNGKFEDVDCIGKKGKCIIKRKKTEKYGYQYDIDFIHQGVEIIKEEPKNEKEMPFNDDIPF
jgi:hypothetical protein